MLEEELEPLAEEEPPEPGEEELAEEPEFDDSPRPAVSSMVNSWAYNREEAQIEITFNSGSTQSFDCTPAEWDEAKAAVSPGRFVWQHFLQ